MSVSLGRGHNVLSHFVLLLLVRVWIILGLYVRARGSKDHRQKNLILHS